jgi:hypothetical protein
MTGARATRAYVSHNSLSVRPVRIDPMMRARAYWYGNSESSPAATYLRRMPASGGKFEEVLPEIGGNKFAVLDVATATPDRLRPGFVHIQRTAFEIGAIQPCYGLIGLVGVAHFDKCEPARAAGVAVRH